MRILKHRPSTTIFTLTSMPTTAQPSARRPRAGAVRPQGALGPVVVGVAKAAISSAVITGAFGGLLEAMAPHGQKSAKRIAGAVQFGGTVGGGAALGVAIPHAIAVVTGVPLGVVVGTSLVGLWLAVSRFAGPHGGRR